jgi:hypothetical protein
MELYIYFLFVCVQNLVLHVKGETQTEGVSEQGAEESGENYMKRNFSFTLNQVLLGSSNTVG